MDMLTRLLHGALLACFVVLAADAQQIRLEIDGGRVSLDARDVSVPQVLAEWERVGGTRVVGGEKISGTTVTLNLAGVTEREALQTLLRDVAGYIATPRKIVASGASRFDSLLVLAASGSLASGARVAATGDNSVGAMNSEPSGVAKAPPNDSLAASNDDRFVERNTVATQPVGLAHSALAFPLLPAGTEVEQPAVGETGRRAEPGMVPVAIPEPTAVRAPRESSPSIGSLIPSLVRTPRQQ